MQKILALSIYPAPYRVKLLALLGQKYNLDVFFEYATGDSRNNSWFLEGDYNLLDEKEGKAKFKRAKFKLKSYDAVILYDFSTIEGIKLIAECIRVHIPYIINCDGIILGKKEKRIKEILKTYLIKHGSGYLASGRYAKRYFLKYGAPEEKIFIHTFSTLAKADILQKPIDMHEKIRLRKLLRLPIDKKIVIAVGRFIPLKRYDCLLHGWKAMSDDYLLLLIGGGEETENYRAIIKKYNIRNVRLEKFHPKSELFEFYKASDIFVHPTSYDVWGLVVNEAMACGLPVVVSDHCIAGLELIKNGFNGYIVKMGNDSEMFHKINKVFENEDTYRMLSINALNTISSYTLEHMASMQIQAIDSVLSKQY